MPARKIACLGGGSLYFARALPDLAAVRGIAGSEVTLYDIDLEKAQVMARHGARLAAASGTGLRVRACETLADAIDGADFAITSIGGSGASTGGVYGTGYHMQDIIIPTRYGIFQIVGDTGGPAGMMMGLRSIPIYVDICREMEKRCPEAVMLQHSNPMAPLCRAINKYTQVNVIGICHGVQIGVIHLARFLGVPAGELDVNWIGTNHYHWFTRIRHNGKDIYPEVMEKLAKAEPPEGGAMTQTLSQVYGYQIAYPDDNHIMEFYPFLAQVRQGEALPYGQEPWLGPEGYNTTIVRREPSAAEKAAQRQADLKEMEDRLAKIELPDAPSDALTGEGLGRMIESISLGRRDVYVVNIENKGCVPNLPSWANLEIEGVTDSQGMRGIYMGDAPLVLMGLLSKRIVWQELVADAAVKGDRNLALQALLLDEMAILPEKAEAMLDELLVASKPMLPRFFK